MTIDPSLQDWTNSDTHHIMDKLSGNQFAFHKTLYRGLEDADRLKDVNFNKLGNHWSSHYNIAEEFANPSWAGEAVDHGEIPAISGSIITARVAPHHIIGYDTPEMDKFQEDEAPDDVLGPDSSEREHTIRTGAPLEVLGVHHQKYTSKMGWENKQFKRFPKKAKA